MKRTRPMSWPPEGGSCDGPKAENSAARTERTALLADLKRGGGQGRESTGSWNALITLDTEIAERRPLNPAPSVREEARQRRSRRAPPRSRRDNEMTELKYGFFHVIQIFKPVSFCMLVVVATISSVTFYTQKGEYLLYTPFHEESGDPGTIVWESLANSGILIAVIATLTCFLIFLYKSRCYRVIQGWLITSTFLCLFFFAYVYFCEVLKAYEIPVDIITVSVVMWNFSFLGMVAVHWIAPLCLQQAYLIFVSALMALIFIKFLPEYTGWVVLAFIALWDLFAVLYPKGPLRILVETAQRRNEPLFPALIYSSTYVTFIGVSVIGIGGIPSDSEERNVAQSSVTDPLNGGGSAAEVFEDVPCESEFASSGGRGSSDGVESEERSPALSSEDDESGIKLGLGDFIFYSVLVGKASSYGDWNTTIACFVAILIGLSLTLLLLAIFRRALPALPISITFGLVFYYLTSVLVAPFCDSLAARQSFI